MSGAAGKKLTDRPHVADCIVSPDRHFLQPQIAGLSAPHIPSLPGI